MSDLRDAPELEVPLETAERCDNDVPESHEEFELALERFKASASELLGAWEEAADDGVDARVQGYPEFLPSFDEFVLELLGMRLGDVSDEPET